MEKKKKIQKGNSMKSREQHMNKMRILREIKMIKKNRLLGNIFWQQTVNTVQKIPSRKLPVLLTWGW